ncbi:hypothetical protein EOI86_23575 [Hwanghaeella grinnelliae]|uniref:TIGR03016 family PEP-CTERM system-associated outer membrane protein n=1 Tax=Hwanghaeella grinnelliae TaxID=2500179 RepID=A0A437QHV5_9PROT|nr:hypothetical protein [Hwanghaeella grinnelliae]RVU34099.1 hypothetical protein EOI86_23575 [Hwanghaeella grinnelliae]
MASAAGVSPVHAYDLNSTARVTASGSYETNPNLVQSNQRHLFEKRLAPGWSGVLDGETYGLAADFGTSFVRTSDETISPDSLRYDTSLAGNLDFERARTSGGFDYSRRAFNNTEFNDNELTTDETDASVSNAVTVDDASLATRFEYDATELLQVFVDNNYRLVSFTGGNSTSFTSNTVTLGSRYEMSDYLSISPEFEYRIFEPDDSDSQNTYEARLRGNYQASDVTQYNVAIGMIRTKQETNVSLDATYIQQLDDVLLQVTASRSLSPSDDGELRDSKRLSAQVSKPLSDVTTIGADAQFRLNDEVEARRGGFNLTHELSDALVVGFNLNVIETIPDNGSSTMQYRADPFLNWLVHENVNARVSYRELWQETGSSGSVNTRRISLAVTYTHPFY